MNNDTILQGFEWFLPDDAQHWNRVAQYAAHWAELGITGVWLPPAYKGHEGIHDVGYGVYNLYDLGVEDQKGTIPTKYGTMDEYLGAIWTLRQNGIYVLADIVLNHRMGEDGWDTVTGRKVQEKHRNKVEGEDFQFDVPTRFEFAGVPGVYDGKILDHTHFISSDRINGQKDKDENYVYKFGTDHWSDEVSKEKDNFQYLMGVGTNFENPDMVDKLIAWGKWYFDITGIDGVRLDALKHIPYSFYPHWLGTLRHHKQQNFLAVGEYWSGDAKELTNYLDNCGDCMSLFDVALHYKLHEFFKEDPAKGDLRQIFDNTLLSQRPHRAITFVDNHDTQPEQALESWVNDDYKALAYALILLQDQGIPCVFYGDMYGVPHNGKKPVPGLEQMIRARRDFGNTSLFEESERNSPTRVGWSRGNAMAVVMSTAGADKMYLPAGRPGERYVDLLGNCPGEVIINGDGWGEFRCSEKSVSVWVSEEYARANQ